MRPIFNLYKNAYSGLPLRAWFLAVVVLINRIGSMVMFFLTLYLTKELGYTITDAGKIISIYGLGSLLGTYVGGWLTDHVGSAKVQITSLFLSGIGYIVACYITDFYLLAVIVFLLAIVVEAFRPANITAMAEACPPEQRARGFALSRLAINLGVAIGPAVGGVLARINYDYLFWVDGLTCLAAGFMFVFISLKFKLGLHKPNVEHIEIVHSPLRDKLNMTLLFFLLVLGLIFFQIFNTWTLYLKDFMGMLEDSIGLLFAYNALFIVLFEMPLIHKLEKRNPLQIIPLGALFIVAGFSLLPLNNSLLFIYFTVTLWTMGEMLVFPLMATWISNRANDKNRGKYMGLYTFTFSLAYTIGPATGAWVYETWSPTILWFGIGGIGLLLFAGFQTIYFKTRQELV